MISDHNREQYRQIHAKDPGYGTGGADSKCRDIIALLNNHRREITSVLDFGAGKRNLEWAIRNNAKHVNITSYDPSIPEIDVLPDRKFDAVITTDVLEHVEPDLLEATIAQLDGFCKKLHVHVIALDLARQLLPDGRNAHLIVESPSWWVGKLAHLGARGDWKVTHGGRKVAVVIWKV